MQRLANFDVSEPFTKSASKLAAQIAFGIGCGFIMIALRSLFDLWAPSSGPFALIYPTVLLATLYGHWRAGIVALVMSFAWAWYFILPEHNSFAFTDPTDPPRVILNAACAVVLVIFAEGFRRAVRATLVSTRESADRRLTLLADLEHRTKNNFALVASLLEIQKRRLAKPELDGPLDDAAARVRTFADAYSNLALGQEEGGEVSIKPYIELLLDRMERAAIPETVMVQRDIDDCILQREVAAAIGLYLNEAVSNAAKYAFPDDREGQIVVTFRKDGAGWMLSVEDDGIGGGAVPVDGGGLGSRLMLAFASQASATHTSGPCDTGFRSVLVATE